MKFTIIGFVFMAMAAVGLALGTSALWVDTQIILGAIYLIGGDILTAIRSRA